MPMQKLFWGISVKVLSEKEFVHFRFYRIFEEYSFDISLGY